MFKRCLRLYIVCKYASQQSYYLNVYIQRQIQLHFFLNISYDAWTYEIMIQNIERPIFF